MTARPWAAGLLGSAAVIAGVTVLARVVGFGRLYVFSQTVGDSCLGSAYQSANLVPNVAFEVVAGGALASVLVPVLAGPLAAGDRARASRTASAALTWSVLGLLVIAAALAVVADPVAALLVGGRTAQECPGVAEITATMLWVFLPQVPLYGVAVVFAGALQSQRRFLAAALAPLASSVVVAAGYLGYAALAPSGAAGRVASVPGPALAALAGGTTLGVLVLALAHTPALRSAITWRPRLRFPREDGAAIRSLATAGIAALLAQQAGLVVVAVLANRVGGGGAVNQWAYAWAMFLLPYAVLAVPVATAAFPGLAEAAAARDGALPAQVAHAARLSALAGAIGAGLLAATALPVAWVLVLGPAGSGRPGDLAGGLVTFAPGLVGYALMAVLSRALYAAGAARAAAVGTAAGWLVAVPADLLLVALAGPDRVVTALGAGHSIGMTVAAVLLARSVVRRLGRPALSGLARTVPVAGAGAALAAGGGWMVVLLIDAGGILANLGVGVLAATVAVGIGAVVVLVGDRPVATAVMSVVRGRGRGRGRGTGGDPTSTPTEDGPRVLLVQATSSGGVVRHLRSVADGLIAAGMAVTVAAPAGNPALQGLPALLPLDLSDRPRPLADLRAARRLRRMIGSADLVHAHGLRAAAVTALARPRRSGRPDQSSRVPLVATLHNAPVGSWRTRAISAVLERIVARRCDVILVVSADLGDRMRRRGADRVLPALVAAPHRAPSGASADQVRAGLGLDGPGHPQPGHPQPGHPQPGHPQPGHPQPVPLLVTVARLAPQKGLDVWLDALGLLAVQQGRSLRAVVAGDGPLLEQLSHRVAQEQLPVSMLGRRDDVPDLLAAADLVVVPSIWEGQPIAVQEALRAGAAVVATDAGGTAAVTGQAALLVPAGDPVALADAVARVLDDPGLAADLRARAQARAAELPDDGDVLEQLLLLYRDLLPG